MFTRFKSWLKNFKFKSFKWTGELVIIGSILGLSFILLVTVVAYENQQRTYDSQYIAHASELRIHSQSIAKNATEAIYGEQAAYRVLREERTAFDIHLEMLTDGGKMLELNKASPYQVLSNPMLNLPPSPESIQKKELEQLRKHWDRVKENVDVVLGNEPVLLSLYRVAGQIRKNFPLIQSGYQEVIEHFEKNNQSTEWSQSALKQIWIAERILYHLQLLLVSDSEDPNRENSVSQLVESIKVDMLGFSSQMYLLQNVTLDQMDLSTQSKIKNNLNQIKEAFYQIEKDIDQLLTYSIVVSVVRSAAGDIYADSQVLLNATSNLNKAYESLPHQRRLLNFIGTFLRVSCIVLLVFFVSRVHYHMKKNMRLIEQNNLMNEEAIKKLLDEIEALADGDLTVRASETQEITGAISKSINYALNALRKLVVAINETVREVTNSANNLRNRGLVLSRDIEDQSKMIVDVTVAVTNMAGSIGQVSSNATTSEGVAIASVDTANKGVSVVADMIMGMGDIRERIQETSKQMKRLGERSQEIGNMVSIIDDLADQTNVLALNAAIQAAMAGDAGRGFAVVADEVQRLAERSSQATSEIELIVKNIQNDTHQAVLSMEQTTSEVVQGASLAQDAGVALEKIESVSKHLAKLIEGISQEAQQQDETSRHIKQSVERINQIAVETASGTTEMAQSIDMLTQLINDLNDSVSGFKLSRNDHG